MATYRSANGRQNKALGRQFVSRCHVLAKKRRKSRQKILSRALKLLPHMPGLPCLACLPCLLALPVVINGAFGLRTVEYLRKMLNALPKHQKNTPTGMCAKWSSCWSAAEAREGHSFPFPYPLPIISCQLLTQPCNSFRQRLHYITQNDPPTHTHTHTTQTTKSIL